MSDDAVLSEVEQALADHFGQRPARASVSFLGVEPIEVLRFEPLPEEWAYVSLGMSRRPMTGANESVLAAEGPRAELLVYVRGAVAAHAEVWRRLAVMAAAPAVEGVIYSAGMSVDLGEPLAGGSVCTGGVVIASSVPGVRTAAGLVDVLRVIPATATELAWCRVRGAPALEERWAQQQVDLLDLGRRAARLD